MKVITKLLFVALLIGVALSLTERVRAQSGEYTCNWTEYGQCYSALQQWMAECTRDCTEDGGGQPTEVCFSVPYSDCEPIPGSNPPQDACVTAMDNECWDTPSSGASCVQGCITEYYEQYNGCLDEYCYQ